MGIGGFFKNLFSSAKQNVDQMADRAEFFAEETIEKVKVAAVPVLEKVDTFAEEAKEKVTEYVPIAEEAIENAFETVKEKAGEFAIKAEEMAGNVIDTVKEKINSFTNDASVTVAETNAHEQAEEKAEGTTNRVEEDAD